MSARRRRSNTNEEALGPLPADWDSAEQRRKRRRMAYMKLAQWKPPVSHVPVPEAPPCVVVNVVSTFNLGVDSLDLHRIAFWCRRVYPAKYQPLQFAAMRQMVRAPHCKNVKALIFTSGAVVLTGADSESVALLSAWHLAHFYRRHLGIAGAQVNDFCIRNKVARFDCGFSVDLDALQHTFGARATYKRWIIQCCRIRNAQNRNIVVLVFAPGKGIITGVKNDEEIRENFREVYQAMLAIRQRRRTQKEVPLLKGMPAYTTVQDTERERQMQRDIDVFEDMMDRSQHLHRTRRQSYIRSELAVPAPPLTLPSHAPLDPFGEEHTLLLESDLRPALLRHLTDDTESTLNERQRESLEHLMLCADLSDQEEEEDDQEAEE